MSGPLVPKIGPDTRPLIAPELFPWLIVAAGLLVAYVPSFYGLFTTIWNTNEQAQGPVVLGVSLWLLYRKWPALYGATDSRASAAGWPLLATGLLLYILGRSQAIQPLEIGSLILVASAVALLLRGAKGLRSIWLPLFFMCFMIPIPGTIVAATTLPISIAVSKVVDSLLFAMGYPIAREGVILQLGQYELLVANACAGLHTLFALEALGFVYLTMVKHDSLMRHLCLAALIIPISFAANIIRVTTLALITYYFGEGAGQGFLHGFAGILLFLTALVLIILADSILRRVPTKS
jgi:exosortase B